jgi:hypothetical protein
LARVPVLLSRPECTFSVIFGPKIEPIKRCAHPFERRWAAFAQLAAPFAAVHAADILTGPGLTKVRPLQLLVNTEKIFGSNLVQYF